MLLHSTLGVTARQDVLTVAQGRQRRLVYQCIDNEMQASGHLQQVLSNKLVAESI